MLVCIWQKEFISICRIYAQVGVKSGKCDHMIFLMGAFVCKSSTSFFVKKNKGEIHDSFFIANRARGGGYDDTMRVWKLVGL